MLKMLNILNLDLKYLMNTSIFDTSLWRMRLQNSCLIWPKIIYNNNFLV
jgi:hypothetical protein